MVEYFNRFFKVLGLGVFDFIGYLCEIWDIFVFKDYLLIIGDLYLIGCYVLYVVLSGVVRKGRGVFW